MGGVKTQAYGHQSTGRAFLARGWVCVGVSVSVSVSVCVCVSVSASVCLCLCLCLCPCLPVCASIATRLLAVAVSACAKD